MAVIVYKAVLTVSHQLTPLLMKNHAITLMISKPSITINIQNAAVFLLRPAQSERIEKPNDMSIEMRARRKFF